MNQGIHGIDLLLHFKGEVVSNGEAYLNWVKEIMGKYQDLIIETCSSGGMRMDYKTLSIFPLVSTSDQTRYYKYPYIAGNILSAVLPEQAAVWSYPADSSGKSEQSFVDDRESINASVTHETVVMNMVNSLLGRLHLASHIELLDDSKKDLIKEGIDYYKRITEDKKIGIPYFPLGFTDFSKEEVAAGFIANNKLFLAVWNLKRKENSIKLKLDFEIKYVRVGYPQKLFTEFSFEGNVFTVNFDQGLQARFFEIDF